ncbi:MAG: RNA-binding protein [Geminicoccaceae bacterium]
MARGAEVSERRCLVTREVKERDQMIRFVLDPAGQVVPDVDERLPGRGMWLSADRNVLKRALAANLFARAARVRVQVAADLAEQVERLLVSRALDCLGLARRAGQVAMGFDQVRACLRSSSAAVLIAAADSAADGRRKLRQLAPDLPVITAFSKAELGAALGREGIVHVAVAPGGLARRLLAGVRRLAGFRAGAMAAPAHETTCFPNELEDTTERP